MAKNFISNSDSPKTLVEKSMLTPEELSARIGVPVATLQTWRTRRNGGEEVGPKFVKLGGDAPISGKSNGRRHVRYLLQHVEEWEQSLAESAA
jgi:hypothetical protein